MNCLLSASNKHIFESLENKVFWLLAGNVIPTCCYVERADNQTHLFHGKNHLTPLSFIHICQLKRCVPTTDINPATSSASGPGVAGPQGLMEHGLQLRMLVFYLKQALHTIGLVGGDRWTRNLATTKQPIASHKDHDSEPKKKKKFIADTEHCGFLSTMSTNLCETARSQLLQPGV